MSRQYAPLSVFHLDGSEVWLWGARPINIPGIVTDPRVLGCRFVDQSHTVLNHYMRMIGVSDVIVMTR